MFLAVQMHHTVSFEKYSQEMNEEMKEDSEAVL